MGNTCETCECELDTSTIDFSQLRRRNERYSTARESDDKIWFELTPDGFRNVPTPYYAHPSDVHTAGNN